ncbi:hypothetical protein [Synechococcus sp. CCAP 1479/9]|uniref:hypothetical protein n=1 Tax=Synechococcus sp. CCAP 1479/9 TaxID=1221593 RepID=UPI001C23CBDB|nr:hypothetical protein [Synechococcus sp. CCAP 1479/9]
MPRTLLLTTSTSIANGTAAMASYQRRGTSWEEEAVDLREEIRERLKGFDLGSEAGRVRASAELNIVHRLPVQRDDDVVLFSTDTADVAPFREVGSGNQKPFMRTSRSSGADPGAPQPATITRFRPAALAA